MYVSQLPDELSIDWLLQDVTPEKMKYPEFSDNPIIDELED